MDPRGTVVLRNALQHAMKNVNQVLKLFTPPKAWSAFWASLGYVVAFQQWVWIPKQWTAHQLSAVCMRLVQLPSLPMHFRAEKRSAQASAHPLSQAQGGNFLCVVLCVDCVCLLLEFWVKCTRCERTVAQKGHTCKLKMLLQTKNFTCKLKMLLHIKNRTCKLKIVHAN